MNNTKKGQSGDIPRFSWPSHLVKPTQCFQDSQRQSSFPRSSFISLVPLSFMVSNILGPGKNRWPKGRRNLEEPKVWDSTRFTRCRQQQQQQAHSQIQHTTSNIHHHHYHMVVIIFRPSVWTTFCTGVTSDLKGKRPVDPEVPSTYATRSG